MIRQSAAASEGYLIRKNVVESLFLNRLGSGLRAPWIAVNTQLTDGPTPAGLSGRGAWDTALAGLPGRGAPEALSEHEQSGQRFSSKPPSSNRFSLLSLPSYFFPMGEVHPAGPTGIGLTISAHTRVRTETLGPGRARQYC